MIIRRNLIVGILLFHIVKIQFSPVNEIRFIKEFGFMLAMGHSGELWNGLKLY
jgi:hypothetical protein